MWFFRCSRRMPPCPWTIGFGRPVVPDEKRTYSGWSNGSASNASGPLSRAASSQATASGERVVLAADVGHVDDGRSDGSPARISATCGAAVDELVAVPVARDGEQHRRLELAEAVEHAPRTELRRARRPDRAEARRRRGRRRASPGHSGGTRRRGRRAARRAPAGRRAPAPPARAGRRTSARSARASASARRPRRAGVLVAADHVLGAVEPRTREPLGAGHLARAEHALVRRVRADLEEVPDRRPRTPSRSETDQR